MAKYHEDLRTTWSFFGIDYSFPFPVSRRYAMLCVREQEGIKLRRSRKQAA
jgi:hypothetical protein